MNTPFIKRGEKTANSKRPNAATIVPPISKVHDTHLGCPKRYRIMGFSSIPPVFTITLVRLASTIFKATKIAASFMCSRLLTLYSNSVIYLSLSTPQ